MKRVALVRSTILVVLTIVACAPGRPEGVPVPPITPVMNVYRAEVVHVSILAPPQLVVDFLADMNNWKTWAPWVRAVSKTSARDWTVETDAGTITVRFVEANSLGVLDHTVTLASGARVHNAMRVLANDSGSELVMVVFQSPPASSDQFERDLQAVRDDLARIKKVLERMPAASQFQNAKPERK